MGQLKVRVQILCGAKVAIGPGKADVLQAIIDHGSISSAGRTLGMSYRRTWMLVAAMNSDWREPLVATVPGGHRGAAVTPMGQEVLAAYRALQSELQDAEQGQAAATLLAMLPKVGVVRE